MEQSPQGILSLSREHTHAQTCKGARAHASACTLPPSHTHACTQIRTNTHTNSDLHEPLHLVSGQIDAGLSRLCDLCGLAKFSCNAFPLPNVIPARRLDTDDEPGTRADSRATVSCPGIHRQIPLQLTSSCRSLRQDGGKRRADSAAERLRIQGPCPRWSGGCKSWRCPFWQRCSQPSRFCCRSQRSLLCTAAEAPWQPCGGVVCRGVGAKLIFHCACSGNPPVGRSCPVRPPVWWQHGMAMMSLPESWPMP